ncbi:hypothetical protein CRM22_000056 [Opisthorchis felineus]|uniref:Uncharacterized protein n=1 Tax=Opisthorchis felineus TaxID=147828 RepID=A0A4S2MGQ3_OPIFE|nr:hypothetical protein CRM22_000056 [Opisthorchis felineus]
MSRLQLFNFQALVLCFFVLEATSALAVEQDAYTKCTKQCGMDPGSIPIDMKDFDCVGECLGTIQKYCEDWSLQGNAKWKEICNSFYIPAVI